MSLEVRRGDIFLVNLNPTLGAEMQGTRPALVIQNDIGNQHASTIIVAAITSKIGKPYPFQIKILASESGLKLDSVVMLDQIRTITKERIIGRKAGRLELSKMQDVDRAILHSLGLTYLLNNF